MKQNSIILHEQQYSRINSILSRLYSDTTARIVFLVHADGQPIATCGDIKAVDTTSFSSLAAGNVAATSSMAKLIGEKAFPALSHEGERESIHICVVGKTLLVVIFDERTTLGLVKFRVRRATQELQAILDEAERATEEQRAKEYALFAEITDEDIDSLFS